MDNLMYMAEIVSRNNTENVLCKKGMNVRCLN